MEESSFSSTSSPDHSLRPALDCRKSNPALVLRATRQYSTFRRGLIKHSFSHQRDHEEAGQAVAVRGPDNRSCCKGGNHVRGKKSAGTSLVPRFGSRLVSYTWQ